MKERLMELQDQVQAVRTALEAMAERAAGLRGRAQALRHEDPPFAAVASHPGHGNGGRDPFMPIGPSSPLADSLERLTQAARSFSITSDMGDGDDGRLVSDAWEIALINEEGK